MKKGILKKKKILTKSLFIIGVGILLLVLPIPFFADYADFFRFLGGSLIFGGVVYQLLLRYPQNIFVSNEEISKHQKIEQIANPKTVSSKISIKAIIFALIIGGFLLNQLLIWKTVLSGGVGKPFSVSINITKKNGK